MSRSLAYNIRKLNILIYSQHVYLLFAEIKTMQTQLFAIKKQYKVPHIFHLLFITC